MNAALLAGRALSYGLGRYREGALGKTLLVGWRDASPLFAIAAGLATDSDRERFAVLARYLLRRDKADEYWLLLSADLSGGAHLVAELGGAAAVQAAPLSGQGEGLSLGPARALDAPAPLGNLLDGGENLPAVMRRDLDRLALDLGIEPPCD